MAEPEEIVLNQLAEMKVSDDIDHDYLNGLVADLAEVADEIDHDYLNGLVADLAE